MKFLLTAVNAKYIHSNPAVYSLRGYVGEELAKHVEIAEYTINQTVGDILGDIYKQKPDVIGFSCYIWNWTVIQQLVVEIHKLLPKMPIWLGGPEVSFDGPKLLDKYPMVTGIMVGEGEETFRQLLSYYVNLENLKCNTKGEQTKAGTIETEELSQIAGLVLSSGATVPRGLTDLSKVPFLYDDLKPFENRIIYYESSRGCPFRCSYCLSSIDKTVRLRDIEIVKKELQFFLDHKVPQVKFVDRTFNCNHNHAMAIWSYILEHDNGVTNFHFEIAADLLKEDEIELLSQMRPGLVQLEIGVQTSNPQTLKEIRRVMDIDHLEQVVAKLSEANNIHLHLDLIAGLPYEDYESFGKSFDRVYGMKPEQLQLGFLKVLKGSYMEEMAQEYGLVYGSLPPYEVLYTKWLSYEQMLKLKRVEEMVELYYNSNQFTHTLPYLEQVFESAFQMYEALAQFYETKGYFINSPSRSYRYQVLLDFATDVDGERSELYKEALTFDLYLRENLKSRPTFAKELSVFKEESREFYLQEEEKRTYLPTYQEYDRKQLAKMTHLEPFYYPVWESAQRVGEGKEFLVEVQALPKPVLVLFDYKERNPLNFEARWMKVN
ncbi:MAG: B12-binding domain-containing radical SAM protein [Lachnospiraceae bacterium]|nr:B12-binding domain-containing radical SAM protein [Lachnospiraceae bacterium]